MTIDENNEPHPNPEGNEDDDNKNNGGTFGLTNCGEV